MALTFHCPNCGERIVVRYLSWGEEAKCFACEQMVEVPRISSVMDNTRSAQPRMTAAAQRVPLPDPDLARDAGGQDAFGWAHLLFSMKGRISRSTYWLQGVLPIWALTILAVMIDAFAGFAADDEMGPAYMITAFATFYPSLALAVKRLHDRDRSGWFLSVGLIPILGPLWVALEMYLLRGTRGSNRYGADPLAETRMVPGRRIVTVAASGTLLMFVALFAVGLLVEGPNGTVISGSDLPSDDVRVLVDLGVLGAHENIRFFYSHGLFSIREDGNFFTDERVVSYEEFEGELLVASAHFREIADIAVYQNELAGGITLVRVFGHDGGYFDLILSQEGGGDTLFCRQLHERWEEQKAALTTM